MLKFVFFGTSNFSVFVLEELEKKGLVPTLVVCSPDKPKGRGLKLTPPPSKVWAESNNIPVFQPQKLSGNAEAEEVLKKEDAQVFIVASYGKILPESILSMPNAGTINVHPSLLPKFRGATPIPSQILADDPHAGVSIMVIDKEVDHGPVIQMKEAVLSRFPLKSSELREILGRTGGELLSEVLEPWVEKKITATEQNHSQATFTKKIHKEDGLLDLAGDSRTNYLKFCAYDDSVGTYFFTEKKDKKIRVKITDAKLEAGVFTPLRIVPEGGKEMSYQDFLRGLK